MNWYLRFQLQEWLLLAAPGWGGLVLGSLVYFTFRADVVAAFLLLLVLQPRTERSRLRPQIAVTFLTPSDIASGSAALPILILCALNTVAAPIFYLRLMEDAAAVYGLVGWQARLFSVMLSAAALLEDFLFAAISVLAFLHVALDDAAGPLRRALHPVLLVLLVGIALTFLSLVLQALMTAVVIPGAWGPITLQEAMLLTGVPMLAIFAAESLIIAWLWRRSVQEVTKFSTSPD